jgi:hypothetical protein
LGITGWATFSACYTASMTELDTASHGAPKLDNGELRHTLTVHEVEAALVAASVPRSRRQIIRYCETGLLEAVKVPGPTGAQWYVSPASLPKAIGDLKQWEAQRAGQSSTELDMSSSVTPEKPLNSNVDTASHGAPKRAMSSSDQANQEASETEPATSRYVQQLEMRIEEKDDVIGLLRGQLTAKDEQIGELSMRYRETHALLGAMQRMLAPLLGQSDPYERDKKGRSRKPNS